MLANIIIIIIVEIFIRAKLATMNRNFVGFNWIILIAMIRHVLYIQSAYLRMFTTYCKQQKLCKRKYFWLSWIFDEPQMKIDEDNNTDEAKFTKVFPTFAWIIIYIYKIQ